jgi:hypothetical protein
MSRCDARVSLPLLYGVPAGAGRVTVLDARPSIEKNRPYSIPLSC